MRILIHSRFHPNVGGIETVTALLAAEWTLAGNVVSVTTDVAANPSAPAHFSFEVYNKPRAAVMISLVREHDLFVHFNISLKAMWPLVVGRLPFVAVHHGFYTTNRAGYRDWREKAKLRIAKKAAANICASRAIADVVAAGADMIPNPYAASLFHGSGSRRLKEIAFVGRLVSDKGADLLVQAIELLRQRGFVPRATIIGDGPERGPLEQLVSRHGLSEQVQFTGVQPQPAIAHLLQQHELLVVPSLWEEPFGVVALEGIASGCVVLGSDGGGLPEAIGPAGALFRRGDVLDLAEKLEWLLSDAGQRERLRAAAPEHLEKHQPDIVARQYLRVFDRVLGSAEKG